MYCSTCSLSRTDVIDSTVDEGWPIDEPVGRGEVDGRLEVVEGMAPEGEVDGIVAVGTAAVDDVDNKSGAGLDVSVTAPEIVVDELERDCDGAVVGTVEAGFERADVEADRTVFDVAGTLLDGRLDALTLSVPADDVDPRRPLVALCPVSVAGKLVGDEPTADEVESELDGDAEIEFVKTDSAPDLE